MSGVTTQKESLSITMRNNQTYRRWESSGLKCITQKPTKQEAYMDDDLDEHLKMYINNCKYLA